MQVETFGDGVIWAVIALLQLVAIVVVILTGDRIDNLADGDGPEDALPRQST
jgi:hypothetical protein